MLSFAQTSRLCKASCATCYLRKQQVFTMTSTARCIHIFIVNTLDHDCDLSCTRWSVGSGSCELWASCCPCFERPSLFPLALQALFDSEQKRLPRPHVSHIDRHVKSLAHGTCDAPHLICAQIQLFVPKEKLVRSSDERYAIEKLAACTTQRRTAVGCRPRRVLPGIRRLEAWMAAKNVF